MLIEKKLIPFGNGGKKENAKEEDESRGTKLSRKEISYMQKRGKSQKGEGAKVSIPLMRLLVKHSLLCEATRSGRSPKARVKRAH